MKSGDLVYYAQVKTPLGLPPTARVLAGRYSKVARYPGMHRVMFDHTPYGLDCHEHWLTPDPISARDLLIARATQEITRHEYQIRLLKQAMQDFDKTLLIHWPPPK